MNQQTFQKLLKEAGYELLKSRIFTQDMLYLHGKDSVEFEASRILNFHAVKNWDSVQKQRPPFVERTPL